MAAIYSGRSLTVSLSSTCTGETERRLVDRLSIRRSGAYRRRRRRTSSIVIMDGIAVRDLLAIDLLPSTEQDACAAAFGHAWAVDI